MSGQTLLATFGPLVVYLAFIVWAIASQRWGIALALSGSFVLFGWNRWRGRGRRSSQG